jgi:hypothetical protein
LPRTRTAPAHMRAGSPGRHAGSAGTRAASTVNRPDSLREGSGGADCGAGGASGRVPPPRELCMSARAIRGRAGRSGAKCSAGVRRTSKVSTARAGPGRGDPAARAGRGGGSISRGREAGRPPGLARVGRRGERTVQSSKYGRPRPEDCLTHAAREIGGSYPGLTSRAARYGRRPGSGAKAGPFGPGRRSRLRIGFAPVG